MRAVKYEFYNESFNWCISISFLTWKVALLLCLAYYYMYILVINFCCWAWRKRLSLIQIFFCKFGSVRFTCTLINIRSGIMEIFKWNSNSQLGLRLHTFSAIILKTYWGNEKSLLCYSNNCMLTEVTLLITVITFKRYVSYFICFLVFLGLTVAIMWH